MSEQPSTSTARVPSRPARQHDDATWIVAFFVIITSAITFFFLQMAQFNLLPQ
jgi:hypothetical protein